VAATRRTPPTLRMLAMCQEGRGRVRVRVRGRGRGRVINHQPRERTADGVSMGHGTAITEVTKEVARGAMALMSTVPPTPPNGIMLHLLIHKLAHKALMPASRYKAVCDVDIHLFISFFLHFQCKRCLFDDIFT